MNGIRAAFTMMATRSVSSSENWKLEQGLYPQTVAPGVVDEFGRVQAIAKSALTVTNTKPAASVATRRFTLTDSRRYTGSASQLAEHSQQPPGEV